MDQLRSELRQPQYNRSANVADGNAVYGYSAAARQQHRQFQVIDAGRLFHNIFAGEIISARSEHGDQGLRISVSTSADDFAPIKQMQLMKFDGTTWEPFGEVISGSGS